MQWRTSKIGLSLGLREEDAVGRAERHGVDARGIEGARDADAILAVLVEVHGDRETRTERAMELGDRQRGVGEGPEAVRVRAHERERDAGERVARQLVLVEVLGALRGLRPRMAPVALRQDLAEIRVPCMVLDEHGERGRLAGRDVRGQALEALLLERELAADDDAHALSLALLLGADDAVEAVAIGDGDGVVAELGGAEDHPLGRRGAGEEAEVRARRQLDVLARPRLDRATERERAP